MMMEFVFSEEKAKENKYDVNKCYEIVDKYFKKYGINKIAEGVYKATDSQNAFNAFSNAVCVFPDTSWFLKVIDDWYWRAEGDDIDDREDCLEAHYKVMAMNL